MDCMLDHSYKLTPNLHKKDIKEDVRRVCIMVTIMEWLRFLEMFIINPVFQPIGFRYRPLGEPLETAIEFSLVSLLRILLTHNVFMTRTYSIRLSKESPFGGY